MSMIELKNIFKIYQMGDNKLTVHNDINLKIEEGDFVAIMGQSGSGKSTLMNVLNPDLHLKTSVVSDFTQKGFWII